MQSKTSANWFPIVVGFCCWLVWFFLISDYSFFDLYHVKLLLLAAPLWLVPMTWQVLNLPGLFQKLALPAGILFFVSFLLSKSIWAAILTLPWLLLTVYAACEKTILWRKKENKKLADHNMFAAFLYLPAGVAWAFADRSGIQPMGFTPTITLLTAVHFHYAGFLLPVLNALILDQKIDLRTWEHFSGWGVIFGVPLTAIGITTTQFGLPQVIEIFFVTVMAGSALLMGVAYIQQGWQFRKQIVGPLWILSGLALMIGMSLAMTYGWRTIIAIPWLTIPWMYAVHGTLNAIGFALPGILGWWLYQNYNVR